MTETVTRVAAIDCGTNSIRLLVVDLDATGQVTRELDRRTTIVRLGEGVDRTGRLAPAALARTFAACDDFGVVLDALRPDRVRFVATSASRDAENADEFVSGVRARLGVDPEVVTGAEEAQLSFAGAVAGLPRDVEGPVLVLDIGGGSTEFVLGSAGAAGPAPGAGGEVRGFSADIGSVRLTERHLHSDPPTAAQVTAATRDIDAAIGAAAAAVPLAQARTVVGVAGSVLTIGALVMGLQRYEPGRIRLAGLGVSKVIMSCESLLAMTRAQRLALPVMHPGRADVIGAGALILARILFAIRPQLAADQITVSEHDILDGVAASLR